MKEPLKRISELKDKKGVSVIFVLMVLLMLFIFTALMLFIFDFWQKTSFKMFSGNEALRYARMGMNDALWEIDNDSLEYDAFTDSWRMRFGGDDVDLNDDGVPDGRWHYVKDRDGDIVGRYAVLVEDESGKININHAGSITGKSEYTVGDMDILSGLIGEETVENIVKYREKRYYAAPSEIKLASGMNEKKYDRIKNYITTFSYDLNVNRKGLRRINLNEASFSCIYEKLKDLGYADGVAVQIALNIIAYRDTDKVPPIYEIKGSKFFGTNKTPYLNEIEAVKPWQKSILGELIIFREIGGQFIELFNPYSEELDIGGWKITGLITILSGVWGGVQRESQEILSDITAGETTIEPERIRNISDNIIATSVIIPKGNKISPRSYFTIGDLLSLMIVIFPSEPPIILPLMIPIREPGGCQYYEPILAVNPGSLGFISDILASIPFLANLGLDSTMRLYDADDNLIEETEYIIDLSTTTVQKNDPRLFGLLDWFPGPPTPGATNVTFQPWVGGEFGNIDWLLNWPTSFNIKNSQFSSLSELSFIHKREAWKTLDFWKYGYDRKILDHFTVVDVPDKPTYGRLNVNTASETVLACLPGVDEGLASAIVNAAPYEDISEILGKYGSGVSLVEILGREITKPGFNFIDDDKDGFIDPEKEKEMIFSRIIDLITVRSNIFKIISLGQKVRNIEKDDKIEEVLAEKKIIIWYDRKKKRVIYKREIL